MSFIIDGLPNEGAKVVEVIKVGTKFGIDIVGTEFSIDIAEKFTPVTSGNKIVLTFKIRDVYTMLRITDNDLAQSFLCQIVPKDYSVHSRLCTSIRKPFDDEKPSPIHEKAKTFKCVICDYSCSLKANLKRHIESVHEERRTFKCDICDCRYSQKFDLKRHVQSVHEERKPFKCDICESRYSEKGDLRRHVQSVHEERKPFKCDNTNKKKKPNVSHWLWELLQLPKHHKVIQFTDEKHGKMVCRVLCQIYRFYAKNQLTQRTTFNIVNKRIGDLSKNA